MSIDSISSVVSCYDVPECPDDLCPICACLTTDTQDTQHERFSNEGPGLKDWINGLDCHWFGDLEGDLETVTSFNTPAPFDSIDSIDSIDFIDCSSPLNSSPLNSFAMTPTSSIDSSFSSFRVSSTSGSCYTSPIIDQLSPEPWNVVSPISSAANIITWSVNSPSTIVPKTTVSFPYNKSKLIAGIRKSITPFSDLIKDPKYFSCKPYPTQSSAFNLLANKYDDSQKCVYYSRINKTQLSHILNLQNFKLSLTGKIQTVVLNVFNRYCVNFQVGVKTSKKLQDLHKHIDLLFYILQPLYPFTKEKYEIIIRRGMYKRMQNNLRIKKHIEKCG